MPKNVDINKSRGTWVQTDRAAHEAWAKLSKIPSASAVMHILCANVGKYNSVVISQAELARLCDISIRSVKNAIAILKKNNWLEVRQLGSTSSVNAYIINDRVAWHGSRDGVRRSLFTATIVAVEDEQPDQDQLENQPPLRKLPKIGERQLPTGPGLDPPSEPALPGMEPSLPEAGQQIDIEDFNPETGELLEGPKTP